MNDEEQDHISRTLVGSAANAGAHARVGMGAFGGLLRAMRQTSDLDQAAGTLLEGIVPLLGLSRASLESIEDRQGALYLSLLAAAGEHAALARDMPPRPLSSSVDAAEAVATRVPVLVGDLHGVGDLAETDNGIARWRAGMSAQAYAVLPLVSPETDEVVGVLTIEWSTPHAFDVQERDALVWMATSLASAMASFRGGADTPRANEPNRPQSPAGTAAGPRVVGLAFSTDGEICSPEDLAVASSAALRVTFTFDDGPQDRAAALWDLIAVAPEGQAAILIGAAQAPAGAATLLAERSRQLLRSALLGGAEPVVALRTLAKWALATAQAGSSVAAGIARIDVRTGEVLVVLGDGVRSTLVGADGRRSVRTGSSASMAPLRDHAIPSEPTPYRFLSLQGDEIVLEASVRASARIERLG